MKKKANITIYREIMEQIEAYEAGILKDAPKADVIYQITEADKDVNIRECKVTLVSVSFTENGYRVWNNQDIKKRCTKKDIDKLLEFFDRIKKADREIYYRTEWDGKYGKCSHSVKLSEIDNKNVSFKKDHLLKEYEIRKKRYLDLYAPREGCTPCAYCGKQVPNDKLVKHRIILQGLENGKRKIKEQVMNFCSGECAMNEQCSREG